MPSSRSCRSSYDCIVKIKGVTMRPILFSQLMRSDGEGAMNPEELFADDRSPASEQERVHEDELHSLMRSILDWAISFLSESSQGTIRAIYFEGKTVKQHSEEEYVTVYAIYKRLARSYPVIKEIVLEELRGSTTRRAPSSRPSSAGWTRRWCWTTPWWRSRRARRWPSSPSFWACSPMTSSSACSCSARCSRSPRP